MGWSRSKTLAQRIKDRLENRSETLIFHGEDTWFARTVEYDFASIYYFLRNAQAFPLTRKLPFPELSNAFDPSSYNGGNEASHSKEKILRYIILIVVFGSTSAKNSKSRVYQCFLNHRRAAAGGL